MFNRKYEINEDFLQHGAQTLRRRFLCVGVANFVLMPFVLMFMLVHFFMKNAEEFHSKKDYLGPREWSPLGLYLIDWLLTYVVWLFGCLVVWLAGWLAG